MYFCSHFSGLVFSTLRRWAHFSIYSYTQMCIFYCFFGRDVLKYPGSKSQNLPNEIGWSERLLFHFYYDFKTHCEPPSSASSFQPEPATTCKKKDTKFFQNNTLYQDVNDKMLEQSSPEKCTSSVTMVVQVKNITNKKRRCILYTCKLEVLFLNHSGHSENWLL